MYFFKNHKICVFFKNHKINLKKLFHLHFPDKGFSKFMVRVSYLIKCGYSIKKGCQFYIPAPYTILSTVKDNLAAFL